MADVALFAGIAGMSVLLFLFILNQRGKLSPDSKKYDAANALGGFLLVYYALALKAWPFFALNIVWAGFSLYQLLRDVTLQKALAGKS